MLFVRCSLIFHSYLAILAAVKTIFLLLRYQLLLLFLRTYIRTLAQGCRRTAVVVAAAAAALAKVTDGRLRVLQYVEYHFEAREIE